MKSLWLLPILLGGAAVNGLSAEDRRWENPVYVTAEAAAAAAAAELGGLSTESPHALRMFIESAAGLPRTTTTTVGDILVSHPTAMLHNPVQRRTIERFEREMPRQQRIVERRLARFGYPELPGLAYCRLVDSVDAFSGLNPTASDRMSLVGGVTYYCRYVVLPLSYVGADNLRELRRSAARSPSTDVDATLRRWQQESYASLVNTFRHELVHVHINSTLGVPAYSDRVDYPTWFHEGSATYLAGDPHSGLSERYREYQNLLFYLVQRHGVRKLQAFYGAVLGGQNVAAALAQVYAIDGSDSLFSHSSRWHRFKGAIQTALWIVALGMVAMAFRGNDLPLIGSLQLLLAGGLIFALTTGLAQHLFGLYGPGAVLVAQLLLGAVSLAAGLAGVIRIRRHRAAGGA